MLPRDFAKAVCQGSLPRQPAKAVCQGSLPRQFAKAVCQGSLPRQFAWLRLIRMSFIVYQGVLAHADIAIRVFPLPANHLKNPRESGISRYRTAAFKRVEANHFPCPDGELVEPLDVFFPFGEAPTYSPSQMCVDGASPCPAWSSAFAEAFLSIPRKNFRRSEMEWRRLTLKQPKACTGLVSTCWHAADTGLVNVYT